MKRFSTKTVLLAALATLAVLSGCATPTLVSDSNDADLLVRRAEWTLGQMAKAPDAGTARYLIGRAKAVALFPGSIKAGFIFGGKMGMGVLCVRLADGKWSPPVFFNMGGANIGLQAGVQSSDVMMVVVSQTGLDAFLNNNLRIGVDASAAAGPVGRQTEASLAAMNLYADIYSYSRSQGLFAGVSLQSDVLGYDADATNYYYGRETTMHQVLKGQITEIPQSALRLAKALEDIGG